MTRETPAPEPKPDGPLDAARRQVAETPLDPAAHVALARHLERAGAPAEAEAHYREAALLDGAESRHRQALAEFLIRHGRPGEAEKVYIELAEDPAHRDVAEMSLGNLLRRQGQPERAAERYRAVLARSPNNPAAHNALGVLAADAGDWKRAAEHYQAAIYFSPRFAHAQSNLGVALHRMGDLDGAIERQRAALEANPKTMPAYAHLAACLSEKGDKDAAEAVYRRALEADPNYLPALVNLANMLNERGQPDQAIELYARAIRAQPNFAPTYSNLAGLLKDQGRVEEAITALERAVKLMPDFPEAQSNLLLTLHYSAEKTPEEIAEAHFEVGRRYAAKAGTPAPHENAPEPDRRLRVGYVSADLRTHPVAFFMEPVLAHHDKSALEVFVYAEHGKDDATTERLRPMADHWRSIRGITDAQADTLIRADEIDILVDLAGHTANNRMTLFARMPAPVQITWLGYPDTTGLPAMDYRITDAVSDPEGETERWHSEALLRLPDGFLCYRPPPDCPAPAPAPAAEPGAVTFASFNNPAKISPKVVALWARVLTALPKARLVMKAKPFADAGPRAWFTKLFAKHGVDAGRIEFVGRLDSLGEHLDYYRHIDIALDSFPYNGTTITCEAFYMGVPVVIREGRMHVARVGASIASTIGAGALVAADDDAYVGIATRLANDLDELRDWRGGLRERMTNSPLMDAAGFTAKLEAAYRGAWHAWCEGRNR